MNEMEKFENEVEKYKKQLDQDISAAIKKYNLPNHPYVIKRICDIALQDGGYNTMDDYTLSAKDLIEEEMEDFIPDLKKKRAEQKKIDQFNKEMNEIINSTETT